MVRRILIVADTDPIITATIEQLMQEQYQILIAADLTEMMQHLCQESDHIAALLIDAAHPDMIRCRMLRKIRQHTQFTDIPIIILSAAPHEAEEETALGYGASEYMRKPFSPGVFKQRLAHLLAPTYRTRLFYPEECDPTTGLLTQEAFYVKAEQVDTMHSR